MAGRRSNQEGTYHQRPSGRWEGRVAVTDPDTGRAKRVTVSGRTKAECREAVKKVVARVAAGRPPTDAATTVGTWLAHWRDHHLDASGRRPASKENYRGAIDRHLIPSPLGEIRLDRLRPHHLEALHVHLRDELGLSAATIRYADSVLRVALAAAVRDGLLAVSPAALVDRPRLEQAEARHLTAAELRALLDAARPGRYYPALLLIATTGLRRAEALALEWRHVNLDAGTARVARATTKTAAGARTVRLAPPVVAELRRWRDRQAAERKKAANVWVESGLVFTSAHGTAVDGRNLLRTVTAAAKRAKLKSVGVHTLRHSWATLALEDGTHVRAVADALGHADPAVTARIYAHAAPRVIADAVDGVANTLGL